MWMNLVHVSPFLNGLLTQEEYKVTQVDFGTAHEWYFAWCIAEIDVHIGSRYFVNGRLDLKCPTSFFVCQPQISLIDLAQQGIVACQKAVPLARGEQHSGLSRRLSTMGGVRGYVSVPDGRGWLL